MQKNTKTQKRVRESGAKSGAASVVMRTPDTLSSTRINQHARFLRMFLSKGAPTFWRMLATTRNGKFAARFRKSIGARDRETARWSFDREPGHCVARVATSGGCLAASSGRHASGRPGSRPLGRAGAAARPRHGVRGSRSSSSARTRPFVARSEASVDHVVRPAPALELHAQGVRAPAGVPGDGERRRGRGVLGHQRGLEGARVFPSPPRPLARTARVRRKRKAERSTPLSRASRV